MKIQRNRIVCLLVALFGVTLLTACGGKEFAYQNSDDIKPGSGLFSGEDGVFTIYSGNLGKEDNKGDPAQ